MKQLLRDPESFYKPAKRPSGHDISNGFGKNGNLGAIPSNLLQIPNTDSNSHYMRVIKALGEERHPARFPLGLPAFFINFLTEPGDLVVDIFSGSNTTGIVAEALGRNWLSIELDRKYAALSAVRFSLQESIWRHGPRFSPHLDQHRIESGFCRGFKPTEILRAAGCRRVFLDGSFVTSKVRPDDFDALWDTTDVDLPLLLQSEPCFGDFSDGRAAQKAKYFGEFFPANFREPSFGGLFLDFFQVDKQTGLPKGIVAIDLQKEIP
jgi:hypothetical protein